jgi:hypothetical protein
MSHNGTITEHDVDKLLSLARQLSDGHEPIAGMMLLAAACIIARNRDTFVKAAADMYDATAYARPQ